MTATHLTILAVLVAASVFGVWIIRNRFPHERLAANNEFTGLTYAIVGAVYGVYLAFTIVVVWGQFDKADTDATLEAVHLSQVWRDVQILNSPSREVLQLQLLAYANAVIEREWPAMARGTGDADPETSRIYENLWRAMYAARSAGSNPADLPFMTEALSEMNQLGVQRRLRLLDSESRLPGVMWALLIGGGIITVAFTYLIGTPHLGVQALITGTLTALIVFSLLLVGALEHPFAGRVHVQPDAFESVQKSFVERLHAAPIPPD